MSSYTNELITQTSIAHDTKIAAVYVKRTNEEKHRSGGTDCGLFLKTVFIIRLLKLTRSVKN